MSTVLAVPQDRAGWAERIAAAWRKSLDAVLETGRALIEAKAALKHGEFLAMIEADLPFQRSAAAMLMKIARDKRLTNSQHAAKLPASWSTLYELTKLDNAMFEAALANDTIKPDMERKEAAALITDKRRPALTPRAGHAADELSTSFGRLYSACNRADLEAEQKRLAQTMVLVEALIHRLPPVGTVGQYIPDAEFRALLKRARK